MKILIRQPLTFSEIGRKDNQEDCIYPKYDEVSNRSSFFILCDGMGGHDNGEVASATICNALGRYFESHIPENGIMTIDIFNQALTFAYDELDKQDTGSVRKMGTTMTCLYLHKNGYLVAHIGDSRIYHVRPQSGIVYQSSDHSLVNDLLRAGELTEEEAKVFPQKNVITRAMQPHLERRHKADVFSFSDIQEGDYFFMCSDGVLEQLTNDKLCEILSNKKLTDVDKLEAIKQVCEGKTKDNYTCYLIPIDDVKTEAGDKDSVQDHIVAGVVVEDSEKSSIQETIKPIKQYVWKVLGKYLGFVVILVGLIAVWKFVISVDNEGTEAESIKENVKEEEERVNGESDIFSVEELRKMDLDTVSIKTVEHFQKENEVKKSVSNTSALPVVNVKSDSTRSKIKMGKKVESETKDVLAQKNVEKDMDSGSTKVADLVKVVVKPDTIKDTETKQEEKKFEEARNAKSLSSGTEDDI